MKLSKYMRLLERNAIALALWCLIWGPLTWSWNHYIVVVSNFFWGWPIWLFLLLVVSLVLATFVPCFAIQRLIRGSVHENKHS